MKKIVIILGLIIIVVGAIGLVFLSGKNDSSNPASGEQQEVADEVEVIDERISKAEITEDGFEPKVINADVDKNYLVEIENKTDRELSLQFMGDDNEELSTVQPGIRLLINMSEPGSHKLQNELNPDQVLEIIVE